MKFSLVMATLGRYKEVVDFLEALSAQTYKNFELIIVDQNDNNRLDDICRGYEGRFHILLIKSEIKGLSVNRNIGMKHITGDIVAFPDDDCVYGSDTLEKVLFFFEKNRDFNFYTCNTKDKWGNSSIMKGNIFNTKITLGNFMTTSISFTIFIRIPCVTSFRFDELLGLGAKYGSAEESDLLLFLIKNKNRGFYFADTYIYHPNSQKNVDTLISYGRGFGALHKKAATYYHYRQFLFRFMLILLKEAVKICLFPRKRERAATMKGRIFGFIHYPR